MNITGIDTGNQSLWDEVRQEAMRTSQQMTTTETSTETGKEVTSAGSREATGISVDAEDLDGDGVVTILERMKAQKKRANPGTASSGTVTTALENVGPNTYERLRTTAGNAYLAQSATTTGGGEETAAPGLQASA